jgi:hypothetical protein
MNGITGRALGIIVLKSLLLRKTLGGTDFS